jgi:hypothetical protein
MLDRKGIASFVAIAFGLTWLIEGIMILGGLRSPAVGKTAAGGGGSAMAFIGPLVLGGMMWMPALATLFTTRFVTREGLAIANIRLGPWRPYFVSALTVPALFLVTYVLSAVLCGVAPDWRFAGFSRSVGIDPSTLSPPAVAVAGLFLGSTILAPFLNGVFGFGEELGWRGYLLPKLMPLGKPKAYAILGIIWGLWHAPLILVGLNYPGHPFLGVLGMIGVTTALGIYLNEQTLRHRSSILAGWIHGAFNCQVYGVWRVLFPDMDPLLGGFTGVVGIAIWTIFGLWDMRRARRPEKLAHILRTDENAGKS